MSNLSKQKVIRCFIKLPQNRGSCVFLILLSGFTSDVLSLQKLCIRLICKVGQMLGLGSSGGVYITLKHLGHLTEV